MEHRLPSNISGGQQQRVALARAVVIEPKVLLFDEPLSNLDAKLREYMRDELRSLQKRLGITSLYVTHDQSEAMAISDKVVLMDKGKIMQVGSPKELYNEPASLFVADFIGKSNFLGCQSEGISQGSAIVEILGKKLYLPIPGKAYKGTKGRMTVIVRPESVKVGPSGKGLYEGRVTKAVFFGNFVEYDVMIGEKTLRVEAPRPQEQEPFKVDESVGISFDLNSVRLLDELPEVMN